MFKQMLLYAFVLILQNLVFLLFHYIKCLEHGCTQKSWKLPVICKLSGCPECIHLVNLQGNCTCHPQRHQAWVSHHSSNSQQFHTNQAITAN